jgi:hypothetical protein
MRGELDMKTGYWVGIFCVLLVVCGAMSLFLLGESEPSQQVEVWSDGKLLRTLSLAVDQELTVESANGTNVVTVRDGAVAVTEADCPDGYCMQRGFCHGGTEIVCLPNRLVLRFVGQQEIDGIVG